MRTKFWLALFLSALAIGGMALFLVPRKASQSSPVASAAPVRRILYYRSAMNPAIHSPVPMKDAMGMPYLPVYAPRPHKSAQAAMSFHVDPRLRESYGVRTVIVGPATSGIAHNAPGIVTVDHHRIVAVSSRLDGWLKSLGPDTVGDRVRRGELIGELYAPVLRAAESDYLMLKHIHAGPQLLQAVAMRLARLGLGPRGQKALARAGHVPLTLPLYAPASGVVVAIGAVSGHYVTPKTAILTIAPRSPVWVRLALPPSAAALVRVGDRVVVRAGNGQVSRGLVRYIYPALDAQDRTLTVRTTLSDPSGWLRPGLYVRARIETHTHAPALTIPRSAVLHTGTGIAYVFVATGGGHFRLQTVALGPASGRTVIVRRGLKKGARVVVHGLFLLDADSHIHGFSARLAGLGGRHD